MDRQMNPRLASGGRSPHFPVGHQNYNSLTLSWYTFSISNEPLGDLAKPWPACQIPTPLSIARRLHKPSTVARCADDCGLTRLMVAAGQSKIVDSYEKPTSPWSRK